MGKKRVLVGYGVDIDAVAGWPLIWRRGQRERYQSMYYYSFHSSQFVR